MRLRHIILSVFLYFLSCQMVWACSSCSVPRMGKASKPNDLSEQPWFVEYVFEEKRWDDMPAAQAHQLHHQGHHFHDKINEQFHHLFFGRHFQNNLSVIGEIPYVVIRSLEIDNHSILGSHQRSEGVGDVRLNADYRFINGENYSVGTLAGIKFPTGATRERNSVGTRFEQELQPGSGSFDYLAGLVFQWKKERFSWGSNAIYEFRTEGTQDFKYGDLFSSSVFADYSLNPESAVPVKVGLDLNVQVEGKQEEHSAEVTDSGGTTVFLGPTVKVLANKAMSIEGTFHSPVYQNLGGVHQEIEYEWTLSGKVIF